MRLPGWTAGLKTLWQYLCCSLAGGSLAPLHASERQGLDFLQRQGLKLVTSNFRCKGGEIDLIMQDRTVRPAMLVFVEVRQRSSAQFGGAAASITAAKQQRLRRAARLYLQQRYPAATGCRTPACRFDVLAIERNLNQASTPTAFPQRTAQSGNSGINWIRNAFDS